MSELVVPASFHAEEEPEPSNVIEVDFEQSLNERLSKVIAAGLVGPFDILKTRLDVVTHFAVPKGSWDAMEASYLETLEVLVAACEERLVRSELLRDVENAPTDLRGA